MMRTLIFRRLAYGLPFALGFLIAGSSGAQPTHLPLPTPPMSEAPPKMDQPSSDLGPTGTGVPGDPTLHEREIRLGALIDQSLAEGSIGGPESRKARAELADIRRTEDRLRRRHHGELTDQETFRLEGRIRTSAAALRRGG